MSQSEALLDEGFHGKAAPAQLACWHCLILVLISGGGGGGGRYVFHVVCNLFDSTLQSK